MTKKNAQKDGLIIDSGLVNISSPSTLVSHTDPLWTVEDVARYLRLEPETVRAMSRGKKLPAVKIGRIWRYRHEEIKEWLQETNNPLANV